MDKTAAVTKQEATKQTEKEHNTMGKVQYIKVWKSKFHTTDFAIVTSGLNQVRLEFTFSIQDQIRNNCFRNNIHILEQYKKLDWAGCPKTQSSKLKVEDDDKKMSDTEDKSQNLAINKNESNSKVESRSHNELVFGQSVGGKA
ncbi:MAG: hypothetical protein LUE14_08950 [Clostridiales bacterium]|nr:hypothetical protein [Clostridiales bacterium]